MLSNQVAREVRTGPAGTAEQVFEDIKLFEAWDRDYYHPLARQFYDRAIQRMLQRFECSPSLPILDAGCGLGEHAIRVARQGFQVVAIDFSTTALDEARRRASKAGVADRIRFEQGDLTRLDFDDNTFQSIFCWGVLIHIPAIEKAVGELVRVLKPRGRLALYLTNKAAWDHSLLKWGRRLLGKPLPATQDLCMGTACCHGTPPRQLWVWHIDIPAFTDYLNEHGMTRIARMPGEFTEIQRRTRGILRSSLLLLNRLYSCVSLPARPCADNLLIFEKCR